jgi:hypothetical protein
MIACSLWVGTPRGSSRASSCQIMFLNIILQRSLFFISTKFDQNCYSYEWLIWIFPLKIVKCQLFCEKAFKKSLSLRAVKFVRIISRAGQTHSKKFQHVAPFLNFFSSGKCLHFFAKKAFSQKSNSLKSKKSCPHQQKGRPYTQNKFQVTATSMAIFRCVNFCDAYCTSSHLKHLGSHIMPNLKALFKSKVFC